MKFITLILIVLISNHANADELLVPSQYPTVQAAIDASFDGDVVTISPGTYREYLDTLGKAITLRSIDPTDPAVVASTILSADIDLDGVGESCVIWAISGETLATTIDGLSITDGRYPYGSAILAYDGDLTVRRCKIFGNESTTEDANLGGAVTTVDGELVIEHCQFDNNRCVRTGQDVVAFEGSLTVSGCEFISTMPTEGDGSCPIRARLGDSLTIQDCTFTGLDGAIHAQSMSSIDIARCTFDQCTSPTAFLDADTISLIDSSITNGDPGETDRLSGDATFVMHSTGGAVVDSCQFTDNTVSTFAGLLSSNVVTISNCEFRRNTGTQFASIGIVSRAVVDNCLFENNSADDVGCIEFGTGDNYLSNSIFSGNSSNRHGAVFANFQADIFVDNCEFSHNRAAGAGSHLKHGGAIAFSSNGRISGYIRRSRFISNFSVDDGGAISVPGADELMIDRCTFVGNSAGKVGGAVNCANFRRNAPELSNCVFIDNTSGVSGGAVFTQQLATVTNCTFANNSSPIASVHQQSEERVDFNNNIILSSGPDPLGYSGVDSDSTIGYSIIPGGYAGPGTVSAIHDIVPMFERLPTSGGDGWGDDPATPGIDESLNDDYGDLTPTSIEAIDAGMNEAVPLDRYDFDGDGDTADNLAEDIIGNPRNSDVASVADTGTGQSPIVDLGAVEVLASSCIADTNHDGMLTPSDFTSWIGAFNTQAIECDQNGDGLCTPTDFTAWIANYNAGC